MHRTAQERSHKGFVPLETTHREDDSSPGPDLALAPVGLDDDPSDAAAAGYQFRSPSAGDRDDPSFETRFEQPADESRSAEAQIVGLDPVDDLRWEMDLQRIARVGLAQGQQRWGIRKGGHPGGPVAKSAVGEQLRDDRAAALGAARPPAGPLWLATVLETARESGQIPVDTDVAVEARRLLSAVIGVATQAVFDPSDWPATRQRAVVKAALGPLAKPKTRTAPKHRH